MQVQDLSPQIAAAVEHFQKQSTAQKAALAGWQATISGLTDAIGEAATAVHQAEEDHPNDPEKVAPHRERLRKLKQERAATKAPSINDFLPVVMAFINGAKTLTPVIVGPDVRKGQTPAEAFNIQVHNADAILRDIAAVRSAPPPADEVAADVLAQLKALAKPPRVDSRGKVALPQVSIPTDKGGVLVPDAVGLLAWALPDVLAKAAGTLALPGAGMTATERRDQLAELYDRLVDALRVEAATATAAEQAGQRIVRRRHVHPGILVGAAVDPVVAYDHLATRRGT